MNKDHGGKEDRPGRFETKLSHIRRKGKSRSNGVKKAEGSQAGSITERRVQFQRIDAIVFALSSGERTHRFFRERKESGSREVLKGSYGLSSKSRGHTRKGNKLRERETSKDFRIEYCRSLRRGMKGLSSASRAKGIFEGVGGVTKQLGVKRVGRSGRRFSKGGL